ncbi:MAG: NfeD family protein [Oscillospiraceae bacterium]|nr:NfeD family protein [Oscillospiraceae bacterium]
MDIMWIWVIVMVLLILIEVFTFNLATIWFACGALVAVFVSAFAPENFAAQIISFVVTSAILLPLTRPFVKKFSRKAIPTNADRFVGEQGVVVEKIENLSATGQVKVLGQIWTARAQDNLTVFDVGEIITVNRLEGVKLIVEAEKIDIEEGAQTHSTLKI